MGTLRKTPSVSEMMSSLWGGQVVLGPLRIVPQQAEVTARRGHRVDAIVEVQWQTQRHPFAVECRAQFTSKDLSLTIDHALSYSRFFNIYPMIFVPYLSRTHLHVLEERQVSGIDLCGNGVVLVPERLLVLLSGSPNQFTSSAPIKNVYRKNSSVVGRAFLGRPVYHSVNEVQSYIQMNGVDIAISTVSKVLRVLEEDVIISRGSGSIRLVQLDKLLEELTLNYRPPTIRGGFHYRTALRREDLMRALVENANRHQVRLIATGVGSLNEYGVMGGEGISSVYCTDHFRLLAGIDAKETMRFPDLEVVETTEHSVYFDSRDRWGFPWASPIQTYLELMAGQQRDKDAAEQVKKFITEEVRRQML